MAGEENPFKKALEGAEAEVRPFSREATNPTKAQQLRTVADLDLVERETLERTPRIADLTVRDLNDLAAEFSGVPTNNPKVAALSLEDIQDIESVFFDFKVAAGKDLAQIGKGQLASVDVSCCCCTPCCCCAATDMSESA
jgi:BMFP domain-containing protein YqiC